jgi:hypothetical protein
MNKLTIEEAIEREELAEKIASMCMAGFSPSQEEHDRASALGLDVRAIREAVDACYDSEEDTL